MNPQILGAIDSLEKKVADLYHKLKSNTGTVPTQVGILKSAQITITSSEILSSSGFSKLLVSSVPGKVLIPVSVNAYRKAGGTAYSISNSVRLFSSSSAGSSSIGNGTLDSVFQSPSPQTTIAPVSTSNFSLIVGNSLYVASNSLVMPSVITGGTGDLIVCVTYTEVDAA